MDYLLANLSHLPAIIFIGVGWGLRLLALFIVPRNRAPTSGMAWLMLIFLAPAPGWVLFLMFGYTKLPRNRRNLQKRVDNYLEAIDDGKNDALEGMGAKYSQVLNLAESLVHMPLAYCDRYEIIDKYDDFFTTLTQDIDNAKEVITVNFYIMALDKSTNAVFDALERAHRRGVNVYVLYDAYCQLRYRTWAKAARMRLEQAGIPVRASLPFSLSVGKYQRPDLRNHRKVVTIDHSIGYTGSQNLIDNTYHRKDDIRYKELVVRMEGHVVKHLEAVFAADWLAETKENILMLDPSPRRRNKNTNLRVQVIPSGPGYTDENNLKVFTALFYAAEYSITIVNPYFVPDDALMMAITSAARRGVAVTMVNSAAEDQFMVSHAQHSFYDKLIEAGVKVYQHKRPVLVHSKFMVIDDEVAVVGSSNLDSRSFMLNSEVTLMVYGEQFASGMQAVADTYLSNARLVEKDRWSKRSASHKLFDNIARLTSSIQ